MTAVFRLEGSAVHDIPSLYAELDRVLMPNEDWRLGASLDALDDLLSGGFGELVPRDHPRVVWADHEHSRRALGARATGDYYRAKLERPDVYSTDAARAALAALEAGTGPTYFELVVGVFADHFDIELVLA